VSAAHRKDSPPQMVPPTQRDRGPEPDGHKLTAVPVTGIWVRRGIEKLAVCIEMDGMWHTLGEWDRQGLISHIFEPVSIRLAPLDEVAHPGLMEDEP
jgi:hypothetical protein